MKTRRATYGASISEFGAVFGLFVLALMLPLVNFLMVGCSAMIIYLYLVDAARDAALTTNVLRAKESVQKSNKKLSSLPLLNLLNIKPSPGCDGLALSLRVTNLKSGAISRSGGAKMMITEIDRSKELYEYHVGASFDISPMISLSGVPGLNAVPGLGKSVTIKYSVDYPLEHPAALLREQN